ncbi:MAG: hypothetical protein K0S34_33 [Bacillales bacterium]|jgi:hypothetical protein|nr:hypothetical protein [Bacillales bacterium]
MYKTIKEAKLPGYKNRKVKVVLKKDKPIDVQQSFFLGDVEF